MEEYRKDYKEEYADSEEEYLDKIPDDLLLEIISKATETAMKSEIEGYKCPSPSPTDDNAEKLERYKDVVDNIVKHCTIANQSNTGRKYDKVKISFRFIQDLYNTTMKLKALREQNRSE